MQTVGKKDSDHLYDYILLPETIFRGIFEGHFSEKCPSENPGRRKNYPSYILHQRVVNINILFSRNCPGKVHFHDIFDKFRPFGMVFI